MTRRVMHAVIVGSVVLACSGALAEGKPTVSDPCRPTVSRKEAELLGSVVSLYTNNADEAIQMLGDAISADPECSAALDFALGNLLLQAGHAGVAEPHYRNAIRKFPQFRDARMNLGRLLLTSDRPDEAVKVFGQLATESLATAETYKLMGHAHLLAGHPVGGEAAYRQALMLNASDRDAEVGLAKSLLRQERYKEALALLADCSRRTPDDLAIWTLRGNAALAAGETREAAVMLESARRIGTLDSTGLATLGDIYMALNQPARAVVCYRRAFSGDDADPARIIRAARGLINIGQTTEAGQLLDHADTLKAYISKGADELEADLLSLRGQIAEAQGKSEEAMGIYRQVLARDPMNGPVLIRLGDIDLAAGHAEEAVMSYERAARCRGSEADALVHQALLEVGRQRYDRAVELLEAAQVFETRPNVAHYLAQIREMAARQ